MTEKVNPFTPSFGSVPPLFAGRKQIKEDILRGLKGGVGDPNRVSLLVGPRGSGKTALLTKIAREALPLGWISADVTALPGMLDDIHERSLEAAVEYVQKEPPSKLTGIGIGPIKLERQFAQAPRGNWRTRMNELIGELNSLDIGLLITVDEANIDLDEIRELVATFQHFIREERKVALLLAGLPHNVTTLLHDKTVSFLRRAVLHHLGSIHEAHEVKETIKQTIELSERTIQSEALDIATNATGGFPYLIQLVGYNMWRQNPHASEISKSDAIEGALYSTAEMNSRIFDVTMRELSDNDVRFLKAMLPDKTVSSISEIAARLGESANFAGQYRLRLIAQGVIGSRGRGKVGFEIPLFRDYLETTLHEHGPDA